MHPRFTTYIQEIKSRVKEIDVQATNQLIDNNEHFCLIDVRDREEYNQAHIANANPISRGLLELKIEEIAIDPNTKIVLYCGGGTRSALAAESLQRMGYENIYSMAGGFRAWQNEGLPVSC